MARDKKATRIVFDPPLNERDLVEVAIERWPEKGITEVYVKWAGGQIWVPVERKKDGGAVVYEVDQDNISDGETWLPTTTSNTGAVAS